MSSQTFDNGNGELITTAKLGNTMATVVAEVRDNRGIVAAIEFYVTVLDGSVEGITYGPYPPDITRRPGWYEKDQVLHTLYPTDVKTVVLNEEGGVLASTKERLNVRTVIADGAGGALTVQDANTPGTAAGTLLFQGAVVNVANGVASFDLDGRYAQFGHTHPYLPLSGGALQGDLELGGRSLLGVNQLRFGAGPGFVSGSAWTYLYDGGTYGPGLAVQKLYLNSTGQYLDGSAGAVITSAGTQTVTGQKTFSALLVGGQIRSSSSSFRGSDDAQLHLNNTAASFLTSTGGALQGRFGSLLLSDRYDAAGNVPGLGIWSKGAISAPHFQSRGWNGGLVGTYDYTMRRTVYAMGATYVPPVDGLSWGSHYGIGYAYESYGGISGLGHQMVVNDNGTTVAAIGSGIWTRGSISATGHVYGNSGYIYTTWFTTSAQNGGLYSSANGNHFYSDSAQYWNVTLGGGANGGIILRSSYATAPLGYLSATTGGYVGLLHEGGSWSYQGWNGGARINGALTTDTIHVGGAAGAGEVNTIFSPNWFRSTGATGWYNQTYGGGWNMEDGTWIRSYNQKSVWLGLGVYGGNGGLTLGRGGAKESGYMMDIVGKSRLCSTEVGSGFGSAAIEVRERSLIGNTGEYGWSNAPRISFHWSGVAGAQIGVAASGRIHILNGSGSANEDVQARDFYNNQGHRMAASLSGSGSPTMTANEGSLYIQY